MTNNHVVDHAKSVQVTTDDGTIYTAKVIGTDPKTDLALIKVDGKSDFPYVEVRRASRREVGDWVVAVGNPFGLGGTVTAGIVSARGRDIGAGPYDDYVQIDAPINKGNSGGPAFDVNGNVIGVNTAIYSPSGGSVGIGFDIPADTAKMVVAQLRKGPRHPRLARRADPAGHRRHRRQPRHEEGRGRDGRRAAERQPGGQGRHQVRRRHHRGQRHAGQGCPRSRPHHRHDGAGLRRSSSTSSARAKPKTRVADAWRRCRTISRPRPTIRRTTRRRAACRISACRSRRRARLPAPASKGVVVTGVDPDGPAAEQGFQTGNVILDVGGKAVANAGDIRHALTEAKSQGKHDVLMRVKTGDTTRFVAMPLDKA